MFWILAIIFGIFLIIDISGHLALSIKRKTSQWALLLLITILTAASIAIGVVEQIKGKEDDGEELYVAYRYMTDGDVPRARNLLASVGGKYKNGANVLDVMSYLVSRDYIQGYFKSQRLSESRELSALDRKYIDKIQKICTEKLGLDNEEEDPDSYEEYLKNFQENELTYLENTDVIVDEEVLELIEEYINELNFTEEEIKSYTEKYEIDRILYIEDISKISFAEIENIKNKYGETEDVLRLICKYYVHIEDFKSARENVDRLIKKYRNEENYVIYTDIIAQEAYVNSKYNKENDVEVRRSINYILAKIPSSGDDTGMYNLQLAKLYFNVGDRNMADKYLYKVINRSMDISDDSCIKEEIDNVISEYNRLIGNDTYTGELDSAIDELIEAQSGNIVPLGENTINGSFDSYVFDTLINDRTDTGEINISENPKLNEYEDINEEKNIITRIDSVKDKNEVPKGKESDVEINYDITSDITNHSYIVATVSFSDKCRMDGMLNGEIKLEDEAEPGQFKIVMEDGFNEVEFRVTDESGNVYTSVKEIYVDTVPPVLSISEEIDNKLTSDSYVYVSGYLEMGASLMINGKNISLKKGWFNEKVFLDYGENLINVIATDAVGNTSVYTATVDREMRKSNRKQLYICVGISFLLSITYLVVFVKGVRRRKNQM